MAVTRPASGQRDRLVTVQRLNPTETQGPSGEPLEDWTTLSALTLRMSREDMVLPESSRERFVAGQVSSRGETRWGSPYHPDIDPELVDVTKARRLVCEGRIYDITAAEMIGRRSAVRFVTLAKVGP